jgi:hypothetical protein
MGIKVLTYVRDYAIPGRRFHRLVCNLQGEQDFCRLADGPKTVKDRMNRLNEERQDTQRQIAALCGHVDICKHCDGLCCRGNYNHFTVIDYLIRMYSESPIHDYGTLRERPMRLVVRERIHDLVYRVDEYDYRTSKPPSDKAHMTCPDLSTSGCRFSPEDRPIRCIMWTCPTFRRHLRTDEFRKIGVLTKRLCSICDEVAQIVRNGHSCG